MRISQFTIRSLLALRPGLSDNLNSTEIHRGWISPRGPPCGLAAGPRKQQTYCSRRAPQGFSPFAPPAAPDEGFELSVSLREKLYIAEVM